MSPVHIKTSRTITFEERERFIHESLFLSRTSHPNIVKFLDAGVNEDGTSFIATEKLRPVSNYNFDNSLEHAFGPDDLVAALSVIDYLAFLELAHGDIKPEHLLRRDDGKIVLIDFAQVFSLSKNALIGTSAYLAPELFWQHGYSVQSDLFSLGLSFIELAYNNDTVTELLSKQGSSLKSWTENDLKMFKDSISESDPLAECLKQMIAYSPLDRPRSGREILQYLLANQAVTWSLDRYDNLISNCLNHYLDHTHWIYLNSPIFKNRQDKVFEIKNCHEACWAAFKHNYDVLQKFNCLGKSNPELIMSDEGISVCKLKYARGPLPRLLPKAIAIPNTVNVGLQLANHPQPGMIDLDYDFHICQYSLYSRHSEGSNLDRSASALSEHLTMLGIRRNFAEGLGYIESCLNIENLNSEDLAVLRAHQAYFLSCTGQVNKADEIFQSFLDEIIECKSDLAKFEIYSCRGWHSFLRGRTDVALDNLHKAIRLLEESAKPSLLSQAIIYNRLSSVVWLKEGSTKAIEISEKALSYATLLGNKEVTFLVQLNRSLYYGDASHLADELKVQQQLKELAFFIKTPALIITYLHNLAANFLRRGEIERALISVKRAYALANGPKRSTTDTANLLSLLGNVFRSSHEMVTATMAFKRAAIIFLKFRTYFAAAKCVQNLAEIYFVEGRNKSALRYLKLARSLYERSGQKLGTLDIDLLKLRYAMPATCEITEIEELLGEYHRLGNLWGEFQSLWLLAIKHLATSNWVGFEHSLRQLQGLSGQMTSQNVQSDIQLITAVYKQLLQAGPDAQSETGLSFFDILKTHSQTFFKEQKQNLIFLLNDYDSIFTDRAALDLVVKEFHLEGKFMKSDSGEKDWDKPQTGSDPALLERFEVIRKIAALTDQSKNLDDYVSKVLDLTVLTLRASRGAIFIASKYSEDIEILGTSGCQKEDVTDIKNISRSLIHHALGGTSIFIRNTATEAKYDKLQSLIAKNIKSAICIPLKKDGEVFGAVYVDSLHFRTQFEDLDKTFLDTFGSIIAGGLSTSYRLQKLNTHYQNALKQGSDIGLKSSEALLLPSAEMQDIYKLIFKVSKTTFPVLLLGQTGSGKDVLARMIHENSSLNNGKLVPINCAAIPADHLEAELFGVASKAFTNVEERQGKIELADKGTLFLDEIAEMPLALQSKLLRVLETREIEPVGGSSIVKTVQFRLVSATNRNLKELVAQGKFREDLFHRVNDVVIKIPDLYKRPRDIEVLVQHFYSFFQNKLNVKCEPIKEIVLDAILKHTWPGGIRELSKVVSNLVAFSDNSVSTLDGLPEIIQAALMDAAAEGGEPGKDDSVTSKENILSVLRKTNFNIREAARHLQMPESSLRYHIKRHKIELIPKGFRA